MIPYFVAYPLDTEGAFALLATGLALAAPEGPAWTAPMLWHRLSNAQPVPLQETEDLMRTTLERFPNQPMLNEALIYTQLLRRENEKALATARQYLQRQKDDARRKRLLLETALSARDAAAAREALGVLDKSQLPTWERQVLQARMDLLEDRVDPARSVLAQLQDATPENPYLNYYLGCADLLKAQARVSQLSAYQGAFKHLELAALQAMHPALRQRAGEALAYARSVLARAGEHPELFAPAPEPTPAP
jgi:hypothetical protein